MRQQAYLKAMGIDIWFRREVLTEDTGISPVQDGISLPEIDVLPSQGSDDLSGLDWQALQIRVSTCKLCELHQGRTQTVFGAGNQQADLLIIGEAPGFDEDRQGEAFVGPAGQLLNAMLKAIKLNRQDVYSTNVLKCLPVNQCESKSQEATLCSRYLKRQIELLQPRLILALGQLAAQNLLQSNNSLTELRGQLHQYAPTRTPMIISYHPADLLQTPANKGKAWQDLLFVQRTLGNPDKAD